VLFLANNFWVVAYDTSTRWSIATTTEVGIKSSAIFFGGPTSVVMASTRLLSLLVLLGTRSARLAVLLAALAFAFASITTC